jgi:hypothetical protein
MYSFQKQDVSSWDNCFVGNKTVFTQLRMGFKFSVIVVWNLIFVFDKISAVKVIKTEFSDP